MTTSFAGTGYAEFSSPSIGIRWNVADRITQTVAVFQGFNGDLMTAATSRIVGDKTGRDHAR